VKIRHQKTKHQNYWTNKVELSDQCRERFLTQSVVPELNEKAIFMAGLAELEGEYLVERSGERVHTVIVTLEGGGTLTTSNSIDEIERNTLTYLEAGTPFRFELSKKQRHWKMVWLLLEPNEQWLPLQQSSHRIIPFHSAEQIWAICSLLYAEINGRNTFRAILLSELVRSITPQPTSFNLSHLRVQKTFNQIETQLHLPWKVSKIAEQSYVSEEHLGKICRKIYQQSPQSKLISLRMDKAKELLQSSDWPINIIAHRVGYKDPYNFSHRFTRSFGISPSKFRKITQEE